MELAVAPDVVPEELGPGLFLVRYSSPEELAPERQRQVLASLRRSAPLRANGLLFVLAPQLRSVDTAVPQFWLDVTSDPSNGLKALAVVAESIGVRIAARGFSVANLLRSVPVAVDAFEDLETAKVWLEERLR